MTRTGTCRIVTLGTGLDKMAVSCERAANNRLAGEATFGGRTDNSGPEGAA
jgi:hypothetical protein